MVQQSWVSNWQEYLRHAKQVLEKVQSNPDDAKAILAEFLDRTLEAAQNHTSHNGLRPKAVQDQAVEDFRSNLIAFVDMAEAWAREDARWSREHLLTLNVWLRESSLLFPDPADDPKRSPNWLPRAGLKLNWRAVGWNPGSCEFLPAVHAFVAEIDDHNRFDRPGSYRCKECREVQPRNPQARRKEEFCGQQCRNRHSSRLHKKRQIRKYGLQEYRKQNAKAERERRRKRKAKSSATLASRPAV